MNISDKSFPIFTTCSICRCRIRADRLESHKRKIHGAYLSEITKQQNNGTNPKKNNKINKNNKAAEQNQPTIWDICPICKCCIRAKNLESHKRQIHGIDPNKKPSCYSKIRKLALRPKNSKSDIIIVNKSRDALGYYKVENGRKFHTLECKFVSYSRIKITEDMLINNYTPCNVCLPDFGKNNGMLPGSRPYDTKSKSYLFTNGAFRKNG